MVKTDNKFIQKYLEDIDNENLYDDFMNYPEDEIGDSTDLQIFIECLDWILYKYNEDSFIQYFELQEAKDLIKETKHGTVFKGLLNSKELEYERGKVLEAEQLVNSINEMNKVFKKLTGMKWKW